MIAESNGDGVRLACENSAVRGYPFRLGLYCDAVVYENPTEGIGFTAGALRSAAQIYNPRFFITELDGDARLEVPGLVAMKLDWESARASVRFDSPLPERVSIETRNLTAVTDDGATQLAAISEGQAHMRPNAGDVDLALSVKEMRLAENLVGTGPVPSLDGGVDMVLEDGVAWFAGGEWSLRGESGTIRNAHIEPGTDASIVASGTFSVDEDGLLDAEVTIEVTNPDRIGKLLADVLPEYEGQIKSTASGLAALGDKAQLPLRVVKGKVSFGPFNLGELAPLP